VCGQFVLLARKLGLLGDAVVAIDGSKFKAVNNRDKNFTAAKMARRLAEIEAAIGRYMVEMDESDAAEPAGQPGSSISRRSWPRCTSTWQSSRSSTSSCRLRPKGRSH
jgi:hypothetical protein